MPQQPSKLAQNLDRAKTCAKAYYGFNTLPGAATDVTRVGTLLAAAPLPKSVLSDLGIRTTTLAGGSSFTNILSVLGQGAGTAASGANFLRIAGRMAGPIAIASAVIDATAIGVCTFIDQGVFMVDRIQRDAASRVLRSFIDGAITNDEFEAQFPRSEEDSALPAIKANVWMLYSDLHRHKLTGKHEPNAETRALLERCVLFLETNLEFEWPVPKIGLSNILPNLWLQAKARLGGSPSRETPQSREGDEDVWPSSEGGTTMRASLPRQDADETGTPPSGVGWTVCIALLVLLGAGLLTRITDDAGVPISCCPRYPRLAYKMMQQSGRRAVLDGSSS